MDGPNEPQEPRVEARVSGRDVPLSRPSRIGEVAAYFLRLGFTAFGGPAAHVGLLEDELVRRRRWVTHQEFLDLLGATNLIPGPNSTELCIHLGYRRAGLAGLILSGFCFILPAASITALLASAYVAYGTVPSFAFALYGIKPVILAVILGAIARLSRTAFKGGFLIALGIAAFALSLAGGNELAILFGGGALGALRALAPRLLRRGGLSAMAPGVPLLVALPATAPLTSGPVAGLLGLGAFFLKVGSVLYGSGYVLVAFLRNGLVAERGWLTESQLLDAIAVGQFTPGPLLSTASFVGYVLQGWMGAVVCTICIFLPSFVFVLLTHRWVSRMRSSPVLSGFLDAVNVVAVGLMGAVVIQLAHGALVGWPAWTIGILGAAGVLLTRVNPTWWILSGGLLGLVAAQAGLVA